MRALINTPFYVISGELAEFDHGMNRDRTQALQALMTDAELAHKEVKGCYKGKGETSFLVICNKSVALGLAISFGQESALFVDQFSEAYLIHPAGAERGRLRHIGTWQETDAHKAKSLDAFTYDPKSRKYYIVV